MGFKAGSRRGNHWDDCKELNELLRKHDFNTTGKSEREFELGLSSTLSTLKDDFNSQIITQTNKSGTVGHVYCFGKKHRPDMTLDDDGIAIELKFVTYSGMKEAIGQGFFYRLKYKFVFLVLVISEDRSKIFYDLDSSEEKDLQDTLKYLADTMNIFTYVVPAFEPKIGTKKCLSYFL